MDDSKLIIFSLALGSVGLYATFLPPVAYIATNYQTEDERKVIREAELIGTGHLLVVAAITAYLAKSSIPILLAILLGASMFATYEYALAKIPEG